MLRYDIFVRLDATRPHSRTLLFFFLMIRPPPSSPLFPYPPLFRSWRRLAAGGPDHQRRFTAEIGRRLGEPDYRPRVTEDPIAHWIDQDCWQPPSLPTTTYRAQRGFGGSSLPKVNEQSRDRNRRSATWFARNRRGGRVILYHRPVGPVLVRDWSVHMDPFTAAA